MEVVVMKNSLPREFKTFNEYKQTTQPNKYKRKSTVGLDPVEYGIKLALDSLAKNMPNPCK